MKNEKEEEEESVRKKRKNDGISKDARRRAKGHNIYEKGWVSLEGRDFTCQHHRQYTHKERVKERERKRVIATPELSDLLGYYRSALRRDETKNVSNEDVRK